MITYKVTLKFDQREYYFDFFTEYQAAIEFISQAQRRYMERDRIRLTAMVTAEIDKETEDN